MSLVKSSKNAAVPDSGLALEDVGIDGITAAQCVQCITRKIFVDSAGVGGVMFCSCGELHSGFVPEPKPWTAGNATRSYVTARAVAQTVPADAVKASSKSCVPPVAKIEKSDVARKLAVGPGNRVYPGALPFSLKLRKRS